ncbi:MAG: MBL fold metallo-hydrolase [Candidatus Methanomethylophilaceae archaeon]
MLEVHVLASGSDGNCAVVQFEDRAVMIDAGLSYKRTKELMNVSGIDETAIDALLITHEHSDHICGAGAVARKLGIPVMCNQNTFNAGSFGKVDYSPIVTLHGFTVAGMNILPLPTSHNAAEPNAFLLDTEDGKVLVATDTGRLTYQVEHALSEADIAIIEANYDKHMLDVGPYPLRLRQLIDSEVGHMSNVACAEAIKKTMNEKRQIFLAHLSKKNNTPDTARETVSEITGIKRYRLDCLEFAGDTRVLRV